MRRRPVVGLGGLHEDVAVQPHLLPVVLADVRVVPVQPRVGELHPGRESLAHRHRLLGLVRSVVAVLEPQPVPVHRGLHVALVLHVHDDLGAFPDLQRGPGDRSVVGQHPHRRVAEPVGHRGDPQIELVSVRQLHDLGRPRVGKARGARSGIDRRQVCSCCAPVCRLGRRGSAGRGGPTRIDLLGDVPGIVRDPAEQRRAPGVLPGEPQEVEPGRLRDATTVHDPARRGRTPAPRSTSGRRGSRWPRRRHGRRAPSRPRRSPPSPPHPRLGRGDPRRTGGAGSGGSSRSGCRGPPSAGRSGTPWSSRISPVASRYRNRSRPRIRWGSGVWRRADRQVRLVGAGELGGDLKAGVAAADHQHAPRRHDLRRPVCAAVELNDLRADALGDRRDAPAPERDRWPPRPARPPRSGRRGSSR